MSELISYNSKEFVSPGRSSEYTEYKTITYSEEMTSSFRDTNLTPKEEVENENNIYDN